MRPLVLCRREAARCELGRAGATEGGPEDARPRKPAQPVLPICDAMDMDFIVAVQGAEAAAVLDSKQQKIDAFRNQLVQMCRTPA